MVAHLALGDSKQFNNGGSLGFGSLGGGRYIAAAGGFGDNSYGGNGKT